MATMMRARDENGESGGPRTRNLARPIPLEMMSFGGGSGDDGRGGNHTDGGNATVENEDPVDFSGTMSEQSVSSGDEEQSETDEDERDYDNDRHGSIGFDETALMIGTDGLLEQPRESAILVDAPSPFDVTTEKIADLDNSAVRQQQRRRGEGRRRREDSTVNQRRQSAAAPTISGRSTRIMAPSSRTAQVGVKASSSTRHLTETRKAAVSSRRPSIDTSTQAASSTADTVETTSVYASTLSTSTCTACFRSVGPLDDHRRPYVALQCGHCYHTECFEMARCDARGSACPSCFSSKRFDNLMTDRMADNVVGTMRALVMDSSIGAVMASAYMNETTASEIWIDMIENGGVLDVVDNPKANLWTECDPNNLSESTRRAKIQGNAVVRSTAKIDRYLSQFVDPSQIVQDGVGVEDFIRAGATVDNFVLAGYTLEHLYTIGFRRWTQLLAIGAHPKHLIMQNGTVPFEVRDLVRYYGHTYAEIITFIAMSIAKVAQPSLADFRRAVHHFCLVGFSADDLHELKLTDVRMLFSYGGQNNADPTQCAVTADGFVALCQNMNVDLDRVRSALRLDARFLLDLRITMQHIEALDWHDDDISREFGSDFMETIREEERRREVARERHNARKMREYGNKGKAKRSSTTLSDDSSKRGGGSEKGARRGGSSSGAGGGGVARRSKKHQSDSEAPSNTNRRRVSGSNAPRRPRNTSSSKVNSENDARIALPPTTVPSSAVAVAEESIIQIPPVGGMSSAVPAQQPPLRSTYKPANSSAKKNSRQSVLI